MQSVRVRAFVRGVPAAVVFERVVAFERYPDLVETVTSVVVRRDDPDAPVSDWEVLFRHGVLRWTEVDRLDREKHVVDFDQTEGDFDIFRGRWVLRDSPDGTAVHFEAAFDFGVPSLETIIDPVAVRVLTETIVRTIEGLFSGDVENAVATSSLDPDWTTEVLAR